MSLAVGSRLGPYEILAPLGAGGMGAVYRARDTRLGREVAVKVVHPRFATDAEQLRRFEQEARAASQLDHPNILVVHDIGSHEGSPYIVSELLAGESLRDKLGAPLPPRKAVEYAVQVANGLAAAHEKGIVHRDLKPENLFVTKDGRIKILDFGVAKLTQPVFPMTTETEAVTATPETGAGIILGTVAYMSPEQIRGGRLDARSDIFSLGVVLYEMLSGKRPFQKDTPPETMTAILGEDPPQLSQTSTSVSPALERIVRHCLEKDPEQRFQSARDAAFDLRSAGDLSSAETRAAQAAPVRLSLRLLTASTLLAAGFAIGALAVWSGRQAMPEPVRVRPLTFSGQDGEPSASPDGRLVAFTSTRDGASRIWVKQLGGGEAPLTSGPDRRPRFSPDGSSVLFLRGEGSRLAVYRAPLVGREPRKILDDVSEADWSPDGGRIAFLRSRAASSQTEWILGVAEVQGGRETVLLTVRDFSLLHVRWSPGGRTIAVIKTVAVGFAPGDEILLVDPSSGKVRAVAPEQPNRPVCGLAWSGPRAAIVFGQPGSVMGDSSGALARVIRKSIGSGRERTLFWASNLFPTIGGSKLYASFDVLGPGRLVFDEMAQRMNLREIPIGPGPLRGDRVLTAGSSRDRQPIYSPDGEQLVFSSNLSGNLDLWALSTRTGALKQLSDDPAQDWDPAFTADGKHILWSSDRSGNLEIWIANADGSGARQLSRDGGDAENPTATADGAWIVYGRADPAKQGIWKIRSDGSGAMRLVPGFFSNAEVSPDGRFATFLRADRFQTTNIVGVVEIATGRVLPFQIRAPYRVGPDASRVLIGRSRWLPDGKAIAWIGEEENGLTGVFAQDFVPDKDTSATRRKLAGFSREYVSESFGIFPDGKKLALSVMTLSGSLLIAEGVPDVEPLLRTRANP